jgi:hypothetical protein
MDMSASENSKQKRRNILVITVGVAVIAVTSGVFLLRAPKNPAQTSISASNPPQAATSTASVDSSAMPVTGNPTAPSVSGANGAAVNTAVVNTPVANSASMTTTSGSISPSSTDQVEIKKKEVAAAGGVSAKLPSATVVMPTAPGLSMTAGMQGKAQVKNEEKTEAAPSSPEGCFTLSYHHKKTSGHNTEESCMAHKNVVKMKYPHASAVCVRVNKTPVAFERSKDKPDQLIIGAVAGPQAEITVRYCLGKAKCAEDCTIPKDDFMNSIGGVAQNDKEDSAGQWEANEKADGAPQARPNVSAHLKGDLRKELENLDQPEEAAQTVFQDWIAGNEAPSCGTRQAMR